MRVRIGQFALALLMLLIDTPIPARSLEGTVHLVCQLQKTEGQLGDVSSDDQSMLERVDVTVFYSQGHMTISGSGSTINFSFTSVPGDQVISQGSDRGWRWSLTRQTITNTGSEVVNAVDNVLVDGPGRNAGWFYYNRLEGTSRTSPSRPPGGQTASGEKKGSLYQIRIQGKCRY